MPISWTKNLILSGLLLAGYVRKSRKIKKRKKNNKEAAESARLKYQRERIRVTAETYCYEFKIYDDGYASAAKGKTENLKERAILEEDIKKGKIAIVLVLELSRLSRDDSLVDYVRWLQLCKDYNVKLATPEQIYDPADHNDWILLLIMGGFTSLEQKSTTERMAQGREQAFYDGKFLGGTPPRPYLYDKAKEQLIVDPLELDVMKKVWALAEQKSAKAIGKELGLPEIAIRRAITDERLLFCQGLRLNPKTGEYITCQWEPVIDSGQAARIKAARKTRKNGSSRRHAGALLFIYCGYCGRTVKTWQNSKRKKDGKRIDYYGCQSKNEKGVCKKSRLIKQNVLDLKVVTNLIGTLENLDELKLYWLEEQKRESPEKSLKALNQREQKLQKSKMNLVTAIAEGVIQPADAKSKMQEIKEALDAVDHEKQVLSIQAEAPPDFDSLNLTFFEFSRLDFEDRRALIHAAIQRIEIYEKNAILTYRFPRSMDGNREARIHLPPSQRRKTYFGDWNWREGISTKRSECESCAIC